MARSSLITKDFEQGERHAHAASELDHRGSGNVPEFKMVDLTTLNRLRLYA
jgi:hypothetical protein